VLGQPGVSQVIVVDGGSMDATREAVRSFPSVKLLESARGRGRQICRGLQEATAGAVLVLHADSRLKDRAAARAIGTLRTYPDVAGGCFGARFDSRQNRFRTVALLNNLRARIFGISFGDQAQFFRRSALAGSLKPLSIMEDIDISLLMKEAGGMAFLSDGVVSSTRRWDRIGYAANFLTVVRLTSLFIIQRRFGPLSCNDSDFYRMYYGKEAA
jgi:glycosyltransferase involved in cell wall biosynthesis